MNPKNAGHAFRILFILASALGMAGIPGKSADAEQSSSGQRMADPMPRMDVNLRGNQVYASGWIVGSDVTVSFDIPGSTKEWDYEKTVTVPEGWGAWCQFTISIDPAEFRIAAEQVARISDGATTRQATLPDLRVTSEDPATDVISGIAPAGSIVDLQSTGAPGDHRRHLVADGSGHWFADFAHPGTGSDEQGVFEIMPGTGAFWVSQAVNDYVGVKFFWDYGPAVRVFPDEERIETYIWPAGSNLTLTIDDPTTPANPDLTRTQMAQEGDMGSGDEAAFEDLGPILPGSTISITDGLVTKTLTIIELASTGVDSKTDTVAGTAEPGSTVNVHICGDNGCSDRQVSAGDDRKWQVDFSMRGQRNDGQNVFDLQPGNDIEVQLVDSDGDSATINWRVPNPPRFEISLAENWIHGFGWIPGTAVTITIDDLSNGIGIDYTETAPVRTDNPWGSDPWVGFEPSLKIEPGDIVTLQDGILIDSYIATQITITSIDITTDTILGIAGPGAHVIAWADTVGRDIFADSAGNWVADFSVPGNEDWESQTVDIRAGSSGDVFDLDEIWNITIIRWGVPNPILQVSANQDYIEGLQWTLGNAITLEIDNPDTLLNPDYTDTKIVELNPQNPDQTYTVFKLSDIYDIQPGYLLSLSDGTITKTHIATSISISNLDLEHDTVSGQAEPGSGVEVWSCDQSDCTFRFVNANEAGIWMADFAHPGSDEREKNTFDLAIGSWVVSVQDDDDGDTTMFVLDVTDPGMAAEPSNTAPTQTPWKPIVFMVLIIVPLILIGSGIWVLGKRRKKGIRPILTNPPIVYEIQS